LSVNGLTKLPAHSLKAGAQSIKQPFQSNNFFKVFWFNPTRPAETSCFDGKTMPDNQQSPRTEVLKMKKSINAPDAFAAERKIVDGQGELVADFERHAASLENKMRAKNLFA
jgi:hypothetical protein